jgi:putative phosphoglycerate mutase
VSTKETEVSAEAVAGYSRISGARRIVFLRHGQTDYNVEHRFQGIIDIPLNSIGHEQALEGGRVLAKRLAGGGRIGGLNADYVSASEVRIVSSPLERALNTAQALARELDALGVEVGEIAIDKRLLERSYGVFEGLDFDQIAEQYPQWLLEWRQTGESVGAGVEPGGVVGDRVRAAVLEHAASVPQGGTLVAVSHGAAIARGVMSTIGLDPRDFDCIRGVDNVHWSELVLAGGGGSGASGAARWRLASHNVGAAPEVFGA